MLIILNSIFAIRNCFLVLFKMTSISLRILTLDNNTYCITIDKTKTVNHLKKELSRKPGFNNKLKYIYHYGGRSLFNTESLRLLKNNDCIYLIEKRENNHDETTPLNRINNREPHLLEILYRRFNLDRNKKRFGGFLPILHYYKSINEIEYFKKNRIININHLKKLESEFNIELMDAIKLGYFNNKLYVVNGQHRHRILLKNIKKFNKPDISIMIDVTICKTWKELEKIINTSNNSLSFNSSELNEFKMDKIKKIINKKFGKNVFKINFPYLNSDNFERNLQNMLFYSDNLAEIIVDKLLKINNHLKKTYLVDKTLLKRLQKHLWTRNKHFYLGVDGDMDWMGLIDSI